MRASILVGLLVLGAAHAAPSREVRVASVEVQRPLPLDLAEPEGRTRWDLREIPRGPVSVRPLAVPDIDRLALRPGERRADAVTVGVGWVHLPAGVREVALQRIREGAFLIHRWVDPGGAVVAEIRGPAAPDGTHRLAVTDGYVVESMEAVTALSKIYVHETEGTPWDRISYGWDRGKGTTVTQLTPEGYATIGDLIAASSWNFAGTTITSSTQIAGTTTANNATTINGTGTAFASDLEVGDRVSLGPAPTTFARVLTIPSATQITVDVPLGNGTTQTIRRRVREAAATTSPVNAAESCNAARCGYTLPGSVLERRDVRFDAGPVKFNSVSQRENRATDVTLWLRAGAQKEGKTGAFGTGESRFCFVTDGTGTRSPVPEWQFQHQDAGGWYMQPGDIWEGGPFACEQNLFNQTCGAAQLFDRLWAQACGTHTGKQGATVLKAGALTLPSGHTFNSLLVRQMSDFCVYAAAGCNALFKVDEVRTVVYLWQVPYLGTPVLIQSVQNAADATSWSAVDQTDIKFGLFPPVTIASGGRTDTTVSLSWNPGNDTRRIDGYKIYWDEDSGGATPYAFDSQTHSGQVAIAGTSATISGLQRGTDYFFTVTALSTFTDPSSGVVTTYESEKYPTQIYGDPDLAYPLEVLQTTTCTPGAQVSGVRVDRDPAGIKVCWDASADICTQGYDVLGSDTASSAAGYTTVGSVNGTTCWTGNPSQRYFLVVVRGVGATGPWGHYGN
jgi:hypothetical protein